MLEIDQRRVNIYPYLDAGYEIDHYIMIIAVCVHEYVTSKLGMSLSEKKCAEAFSIPLNYTRITKRTH